jgi:hypothetical protein
MGQCLAHGAAITSLGLALAIWIRSVARVLALCVGAVVAVTVGSIPVVLLLFGRMNQAAPCVAMVSPFFGVGFYTDVIGRGGPAEIWPVSTFFALVWIAVYAAAAFVLAIAARESFDRCLGRMPEQPVMPALVGTSGKPRRKPAVALVDEV